MLVFDHMLLFIVQTEPRNGNNITNNHRKIVLLSSQSQLPSAENSDLLILRTVKLMTALELLIEKNYPVFLRSYFLQSPAGSGKAQLNSSPFVYLHKYWPGISAEAQRVLVGFPAVCEECLRQRFSRHVRRPGAPPAACPSGPCTALPAPCSSSPLPEH